MKGMASTPDYYVPPAEGPHPATVIAAEPQLSKKGVTMIHLQVQLDGMSEVVDDYLITDGTAKGAGMGKTKLRGLGIDVSSDAEVPDEQICAQLLQRKCIIEIAHENSQRKAEDGTYVNATHFDERTGQTIQLKRASAKGYRQANVGGMARAPAQQLQQAPAQYQQQAPVQFAPQAAPPQYAQPQQGYAPQMAQQVPMQYAQPQQLPQQQMYAAQAPQQYAAAQPMYAAPPQVPQQAPVQFAPPAQPAPVPWATAPGAPGTDPAVNGEEKKKRKSKVADEAQG